jgi:Na+/melibiose symporter-like transporter
VTDNSGDTRDYIEHARWLLEWHNKRSEALTTRAVALLGFVGVILSLLLRGTPQQVDPSWWTWAWFVLTVVALLVSAALALWCVATTKVEMPSIQDLREKWADYSDKPEPGSGVKQMAEDLLHGQDLHGKSPLAEAKKEADKRVSRFKRAAIALFVAFAFLTCLIVNVLLHVRGEVT